MERRNHYCTHCHVTTVFLSQEHQRQCTRCGVVVELIARRADEQVLVGDPFRSFKRGFE